MGLLCTQIPIINGVPLKPLWLAPQDKNAAAMRLGIGQDRFDLILWLAP